MTQLFTFFFPLLLLLSLLFITASGYFGYSLLVTLVTEHSQRLIPTTSRDYLAAEQKSYSQSAASEAFTEESVAYLAG